MSISLPDQAELYLEGRNSNDFAPFIYLDPRHWDIPKPFANKPKGLVFDTLVWLFCEVGT